LKNIETQSSRGFQEPYIGMPVRGIRDYDCYRCPERDLERGPAREYIRPDCEMPGYAESSCDAVDVCRVGMAYVPMQRWRDIYDTKKALSRGTIFAELDMPFLGGGGR
jgi:hypothetical protein